MAFSAFHRTDSVQVHSPRPEPMRSAAACGDPAGWFEACEGGEAGRNFPAYGAGLDALAVLTTGPALLPFCYHGGPKRAGISRNAPDRALVATCTQTRRCGVTPAPSASYEKPTVRISGPSTTRGTTPTSRNSRRSGSVPTDGRWR